MNALTAPRPAPPFDLADARPAPPPPTIVGQGDVIRDLLTSLRRLAQTNARLLITGESGVGKELVASYVHAASQRASAPMVAVNCAGLPETLLESELFGHVRGSFTGAYRDKPGKFELAHTGTLFLDEVGEMTLRMQGLLLRVLDTGELQKVGADRWTSRVDCRVIAATNRNLQEMVQQGQFREDLYYRLDVIHVKVPPLRERKEDIPRLADYFLQRLIPDPEIAPVLSSDLYAALQAYHWPGNVRQLENVVQRLVLLSRAGDVISAADLPTELRRAAVPSTAEPRQERRRRVADALYHRIQQGESFWAVVWAPYMEHDITRADVRELVRMGLRESRGNYRGLTKLFNVEPAKYKRLMSFLRKHQCLLPYREYR